MMTAHHMLVFGCEEPGSSQPVWNCGEMSVKQPGLESSRPCASGDQIIYAWGMDAPELHLPEGVGFRFNYGYIIFIATVVKLFPSLPLAKFIFSNEATL